MRKYSKLSGKFAKRIQKRIFLWYTSNRKILKKDVILMSEQQKLLIEDTMNLSDELIKK